MRRLAVAVSALTVGFVLACTVDRVVGENATLDGGPDGGPDSGTDGGPGPTDGGTPICPGSEATCDPICGTQTCSSGCTALSDCVINCSGTSCSFTCERNSPSCSPATCDPGPCQIDCTNVAETVNCSMTCNPAQTCKADCHNGKCTVACGQLTPATVCDAGVYTCSESCPP